MIVLLTSKIPHDRFAREGKLNLRNYKFKFSIIRVFIISKKSKAINLKKKFNTSTK